MGDSFQNEVPTARVNIKLDLHTGGVQKKVELPLKLLTVGDFSNGREQRPLSEREKVDINKNNFNDVLAKFSPVVNLSVKIRWLVMTERTILTLPLKISAISNPNRSQEISHNYAFC
ncbi:T6SS protein Cts2S [Citrobacter youngae]|nr:T6SS protein Cts2S [Citrobacter youngae]